MALAGDAGKRGSGFHSIQFVGFDGNVQHRCSIRIFGFTATQALGQSLDLIIPERFRARHWEGYRQVIMTGTSKYQSEVLRVPAQHQDGHALSIAFTVTLLDSPDGGTRVIAAIVRDETPRWNEERELKRRLAELEQRQK